jgi:cephalosporin hydroxylase
MEYNLTVDMGRERTQTNLTYIFNKFGVPNTMIEIGCFEGATTFWCVEQITSFNSKFKIFAIDAFDGYDDDEKKSPEYGCTTKNDLIDYSLIKSRFLENKKNCKFDVVELIESKSDDALIQLINKKIIAELIYVDGDHSAAGVLRDMILSWKLLPVGGVMLCDDAIGWKLVDNVGSSPVQLSPRMGIEMFIQSHWHKIELIPLPNSFQVAFLKTGK